MTCHTWLLNYDSMHNQKRTLSDPYWSFSLEFSQLCRYRRQSSSDGSSEAQKAHKMLALMQSKVHFAFLINDLRPYIMTQPQDWQCSSSSSLSESLSLGWNFQTEVRSFPFLSFHCTFRLLMRSRLESTRSAAFESSSWRSLTFSEGKLIESFWAAPAVMAVDGKFWKKNKCGEQSNWDGK